MLSFLIAGALLAPAEFRLDRVQESLAATYRHYQQVVDGIPVIGGERIEREIAGKTQVVYEKSVAPAILPASAGKITGAAQNLVYLNGRLARRTITARSRLEPYLTYVDAATGEELRREPLFWQSAARVFEHNPVVTLNDPSLQDQNNSAAAVPDAAYSTVDITTLQGPNAQIVDIESPFTAHADPSQPLLFDRSRVEFEEVNAYYTIDRAQRYLQSLGYTGVRRLVNYAIPVDPHAADGGDNSYYIQSGTPGRGTLYFGDGGTDDAEDADLMVHEFGHAIEDWIAPGTFAGANASESRALGEGFGDYWAFSDKYGAAITSGRDPYCIADWDARCGNDDPSQQCGYPAGANCLRRVDSTKTMADFQRSGGAGTEHRNGEIWSSALRQIFLELVSRYGLADGKRISDTIVIESHFGAPPNPTYRAMAEKMLDADRLLYGGASSDVICSAMTQRGILTACDRLPRGERTTFQSPQQGMAIPDNDQQGIESQLTIDDLREVVNLYVHVDIAHPARGDLRITLVAPDGAEVLLHGNSLDRTADIHGTYGLDLMPEQPLDVLTGRPATGTWKLRIADTLPGDAGTLLSWGLVVQFFGDEPSNARPESPAGSQFIAAVAHAPGANGTMWRTDVRLMNRGTSQAGVTLVFTPSGEDGNSRFGAVKISVAPLQVVALDDIVAEQFQTVGTGQLEIIGNVIANARTYTDASPGTYGQFTQAVSGDSVAAGQPPLVLTLVRNDDAFRTNIGFAEISGRAGTIRERLYDAASGDLLRETTYTIAAFSHRQELVTGAPGRLISLIDVVDGGARVIAYAAVVDNRTGDPIYVPAGRPGSAASQVAPVINAAGAFDTHWTSEVSMDVPGMHATFIDAPTGQRIDQTFATDRVENVVAAFGRSGTFGLLRIEVPVNAIAFARTSTPGDGGTFGQFVPFRPIDTAADTVMPVESSLFFRTNIGVANLAGEPAVLRIVVRDSGGTTIGSLDVAAGPLRLVQVPISAIIGVTTLRSGSASVERLSGSGPFLLYASVVDNASGDAVHIPAQ